MVGATVDLDFVVNLTRDLIRFPSVNPPGNEQKVAEFLGTHMTDLGMEVEVQPFADERSNVIGRIRGSGEGHLVLSGHLDVVPPGDQPWQHEPFSADLIDGRIYGRGSCDMKGGVAAMVGAAALLLREGFKPRADFIIVATGGEEAGMQGAKTVVDERSLRGARNLVIGEPTGLDVFIGEKGVFWTRLKAFGRTGHGAMPWQGVNAISYLSRLIPRLETYPFDFTESELLGKPTLSVNTIRGGNKTNVVPDMCVIEIDMRTLPSQDHDELLSGLREVAQQVADEFDSEIRVEVEVDLQTQALETAESDPLVSAMVQSVQRVLGRRPEVGGVNYATDGAHLGPGFGIPMVICGPGSTTMLHQPNEFIDVEQLAQATEIYAELARTLLL